MVDPELLARLLDQHGAALELFAAQWTELAEDMVQEAFLELARLAEPPRQPAAWLFRVVRNRAISAARSRARRTRHEREAAHQRRTWFAPPAGDGLDDAELTSGLRRIDDQLREVVVARIWGGLTFAQIADVVGVSSSAAHRRYEAGLDALRKELGLRWLNETKMRVI